MGICRKEYRTVFQSFINTTGSIWILDEFKAIISNM